ncbi:MAG TPA: S-methyl-5-thioribose-1-phosphate isomerase [Thermoanaerobaculia bacterium]|nr:S-methyl-5-thioribose-1-phosphate isomerase [Thermoanaerobaculia bacterium]HUM28884.1 S-methyl-5-thioribose-1-phosphate isomerase [Thermoanaerobaculia bacterium]HXK67183.1 S-methyl-5-thioribose-1-phosphate isomerase [Thermoanaerobaculia bacterium]
MIEKTKTFSPMKWRNGRLSLLDQRVLPAEEVWLTCEDCQSVADAIRDMVVRGAPAIGVTAAYGMALAAKEGIDLEDARQMLLATRPTAVNLGWAISRMEGIWRKSGGDWKFLKTEADRIMEEDIEANLRMGELGAELIGQVGCVMTICNAGALATAGYGTALGVIRSLFRQNRDLMVMVPETRPWLQGARLTAWELQRDGINVTVITDNMVGWTMKQKNVQAVITGADRIVASGDAANKIGTYGMAHLAAAHKIPFYIAAPWSTVDMKLASGDDIPIEERDPEEVKAFRGLKIAPDSADAWHPAFDVTPGRLISAIITERGIAQPPLNQSLRALQ